MNDASVVECSSETIGRTKPARRRLRYVTFKRIEALLWAMVIGLAITFAYFASSVCVTLVMATFLSILLDPIVSFFQRVRVPRSVSAALLILTGMLGVALLGYGSYSRASDFLETFPTYADRLRNLTEPLTHKIAKVEEGAGKLNPDQGKKVAEVKVRQPPSWLSYMVRGFGSASSAIVILGVLPFLMFFMLTQKAKWRRAMAQLLGPRIDAEEFSNRLEQMVRRFALGNLVVGLLMAGATIGLLFWLKIQGALLIGALSGFLNLIPFLGFLLAGLVPMAAAFLQGSPVGSILVIGLTVALLHLVASNLVIPRFVGSRINVGPVAATAGVLFWGWLWGIMGILLAIPLTGVIKLIADCHPSLRPLSSALGESSVVSRNKAKGGDDLILPAPVSTRVTE